MKRGILILVLAGFAVSLGMGAADAINIDEAVTYALRNNHKLKQFDYLDGASREDVGASMAPFFPSFDLSYGYTEREERSGFSGRTSSVFSAAFTYNLFNGFSDLDSMYEARLKAVAQSYKGKSVEADIIFAVKSAYTELLRSMRQSETATEAVEMLTRQVRDAELYYREGLLAKNDLLKIEVELASAEQDLVQAEGGLRNARKRLSRMTGVAISDDEKIEEFGGLPSPADKTFDALKDEMIENRSELGYLRAVRDAYAKNKDAVGGGYLPRVDLVMSYDQYGHSHYPNGMNGTTYSYDRKVMLNAKWNIFDGFRKSHAMDKLSLLRQAADEELKDTQEQFIFDLNEAIEAYKIAEGKLKVAEKAVGQAEENYRVTAIQYRERVATTSDVLDARTFLTRAKNQRNSALYDLHLASAKIERVIERSGMPVIESKGDK